MTPAGYEHGELMVTISSVIRSHVRSRGLGRVLGGDPGVILGRDPDRLRAPNVCFVSAGRLPEGRAPKGFSDVVPDFVVEIVSPGDSATEVHNKIVEWLTAG